MIRQFDNNVWLNRSQQTTGHVTVIFPEHQSHHHHHRRQSRPVPVQHAHVNCRVLPRYYDEFDYMDKEKQAATGRWVLNVIAAHEAYHAALKANKNRGQSNKKHSFQSRLSSKVEPIECSSSQFTATNFHPTQRQNQNVHSLPYAEMFTNTTLSDGNRTRLSSFSTTTSVDRMDAQGRSDGYSTEEFRENDNRTCISKRIIVGCTILSTILIVGIIVAVLVTIFVARNQSSSTSGNSQNGKSLSISTPICPTELFNLTDSSCQGQIPYQYYSCSYMTTSTSLTIRFTFQHDTTSGHWYFDDISAVQDVHGQLIINGGFENNFTGWKIKVSDNSTLDTYVDRTTGLAHTGSAYLHGGSKNTPSYIEQTFNVTNGEYIHLSFWWGYDSGLNIGNMCQAMGELILSS